MAVVHAHLHLKRGLRRHAVVVVNVSGGVGRGHRRLGPGGAAERAERHHVAKVLAGVLLLRNGLTAAEGCSRGNVFNLCLIFGAPPAASKGRNKSSSTAEPPPPREKKKVTP